MFWLEPRIFKKYLKTNKQLLVLLVRDINWTSFSSISSSKAAWSVSFDDKMREREWRGLTNEYALPSSHKDRFILRWCCEWLMQQQQHLFSVSAFFFSPMAAIFTRLSAASGRVGLQRWHPPKHIVLVREEEREGTECHHSAKWLLCGMEATARSNLQFYNEETASWANNWEPPSPSTACVDFEDDDDVTGITLAARSYIMASRKEPAPPVTGGVMSCLCLQAETLNKGQYREIFKRCWQISLPKVKVVDLMRSLISPLTETVSAFPTSYCAVWLC